MQAGLSLCWVHIPHCWKSCVAAQVIYTQVLIFRVSLHFCLMEGDEVRIPPVHVFCNHKKPFEHKFVYFIFFDVKVVR